MDIEPKNSEQIKQKFMEISSTFINQMSGKLITNMNDILKTSDTKLKLAQVEEKFRKNLNDKWSIEFDNLWRSKNMNEKIMELNELKQKHKQKHKAWRAHGHSAEQQTQLSRNSLMSLHMDNMQVLLEKQTEELEKLVFDVEARRSHFYDISKQRSKILEKMDFKEDELHKHLDEMNES